MSPVSSVEPSSTTMISSTARVCARTESMARGNRVRRLYVGIITETSMSHAMLKDVSRKLLYTSGLLGLYHRLRNADSLTVVMFHRTLSPDDPRWASCDPDYTLSTERLEQSLAFFRRHYNVVSLEQVLASRRTG